MYFIQHCFICRPSDSNVSEDAGIEPGTVATSELAVRHSKQLGYSRSHPRYTYLALKIHFVLTFFADSVGLILIDRYIYA
jgi:hypothetical protein